MKPTKYKFGSEWLTKAEIIRRTGMSVRTLNKRIEKGIDLAKPTRANKHRFLFRGQMRPVSEIAAIVDRSETWVRACVMAGLDVDHAKASGRNPPQERFYNLFDDDLPFAQDARAQHAWNYFQRGEPVSTDEEIREAMAEWVAGEFGAGARLSDEGVAWAREQLRLAMFVNGKHHTGDGEQLEIVGDLFGVSRERIRQIEARAMRRSRRIALAAGQTPRILEQLRELDVNRSETSAERMEKHAPGNPDIGPWQRTHPFAQIAKLSGRLSDIDSAALEYSKRGNRAAARSRRKAA